VPAGLFILFQAILLLFVVPVLVVVCCAPGHLQGGCGCRREAVLRQEREETGAALEGRERTGAGGDLVAREGAGGRGSAGCSRVGAWAPGEMRARR
jgi:hypothetical protein